MLTLTRRPARMLDDVFFGWPFGQEPDGTLTASWTPAVDVFEDKDHVRITVEVPGVNPDDIKISLEQNTLTISGEKKQVSEEKTERVHRYERTYGSFTRRFTLPSTVDAEKIEAKAEQGVLSLEIPKAEKAKPRSIAINVG
jgi:HSP20 family protein